MSILSLKRKAPAVDEAPGRWIEPRLEPGRPIKSNLIRRKCSPMMCSRESGRKWWMSATRPASELSIGIIARSALPCSTAAKTSSKDAQATAAQSG